MRYDDEAAGARPQASADAVYRWRAPDRVLASVRVTMIPQYHSRRSELRLLICASVPGAVFGLSHAQATRPSSAVRRPVRMIYMLIDAATTQVTG